MAAGFLSAPGTEYGPCEGECQHADCASTRRLAEKVCPHCDEPIGYDRGFYQDGAWTVLEHEVCALRATEVASHAGE
jgi:hypothetical protein